ncbi:hypothetical protein Abr02nite_42210 [Paractinoplanes brasiliensis]|nr:hypothetical protein Abr02nite_42210 [Actinoplanes brasiliensis]
MAAWKQTSPSTRASAASSSNARQPGRGRGPVACIRFTGSFWPAATGPVIGPWDYIPGLTTDADPPSTVRPMRRLTDAHGPGPALASQRPARHRATQRPT